MPISSKRYVDITSTVGGASAVKTKDLLMRVYTSQAIIPVGAVRTFGSDEMATITTLFGAGSDEVRIAEYYFGFVSKASTKPSKIQFARWAKTASTSVMYTGQILGDIEEIKKIPKFKLKLSYADEIKETGEIDISTQKDLSSVASTIQTAVKAQFNSATNLTVKYDVARKIFIIDTQDKKKIFFVSINKDDANIMGFKTGTHSVGADIETITQCLTNTEQNNNNFGSYIFIDELTTAQIKESANWVAGKNIEYIYSQAVTDKTCSDVANAVKTIASTCLTYNMVKGEYHHVLPCAILASQRFDFVNASANYMFQPDGRLTPDVTNNDLATILDNYKVNYYGQSAEGANPFSFYQRGQLCGDSKSPAFIGIHANEQWLKSEIKAQFLSMFIALNTVNADSSGIAIGTSYLNTVVQKALLNGVITTGKPLTQTQIVFITSETHDPHAYSAVQSKGYWFKVSVDPDKNEMDYLLIYSKADTINKVSGRHSLT